MTVFNKYADFYDSLYKDKDYSKESDYIDVLFKRCNREIHSVLDLGCGTGRHATALVEKGYQVTGVDISNHMLNIAAQNKAALPGALQSQLQFLHGDVRKLELQENFDAVISLFHVASYQVMDADANMYFQNAKTHLKPSGIFCFDCWYGPGVLADPPEVREKTIHIIGEVYQRTATPVFEPEINAVTVNYSILNDSKTQVVQESHRMRYFFEAELVSLLAYNDMQLINIYQPLTTETVNGQSWTAMVIAGHK